MEYLWTRPFIAHVKLDIASDLVRIDVRGSLTQDSRPSLVEIIQRVRRMGINSHIRVDLGRAAVVESSALAGLRNDLNAAAAGAPARHSPAHCRRQAASPLS